MFSEKPLTLLLTAQMSGGANPNMTGASSFITSAILHIWVWRSADSSGAFWAAASFAAWAAESGVRVLTGEVQRPVIWEMSRKFPDVIFDIRQASVQNEIGIMAVLLTGKEPEVKAAIEFLRSKGVMVEPIEKSVVEG